MTKPADLNKDRPVYQTYGRRKNRGWSAEDDALLAHPFCRLDFDFTEDIWQSHFPSHGLGLQRWLEIGFGFGEHLCAMAMAHPDWTFLGAEVFLSGLAGCAQSLKDQDIQNVCITQVDARRILDHLPENSLDGVSLLFPDPWPKTRHEKRQMFSKRFALTLQRVLKPKGIFRFASDAMAYVEKVETTLAEPTLGFKRLWQVTSPERPHVLDWPQTRYEAKALLSGRQCSYFHFESTKEDR
jgi:tRNA (guanine-N7-)-methyltransferase